MKKIRISRVLLFLLMACVIAAAIAVSFISTVARPTEPDAGTPSGIILTDEDSTTPAVNTVSSEERPFSDEPAAVIEGEEDDTKTPEDPIDEIGEEPAPQFENDSASEEQSAELPAPQPSTCSYCGSANHSYAYCAQRAVDNGANGRWVVPNAGINVACYWTTGHCSASEYEAALAKAQAIVDAWDSATISDMSCGGLVIGDHSNQEFSALKYVYESMEAYMDYGTYQQKYVCTRFEYGHNNETGGITDENYNRIYTDAGDILCYTCNGCWQNLIVAVFSPVHD